VNKVLLLTMKREASNHVLQVLCMMLTVVTHCILGFIWSMLPKSSEVWSHFPKPQKISELDQTPPVPSAQKEFSNGI